MAACFAAGFLLAAGWRIHGPPGKAPQPPAAIDPGLAGAQRELAGQLEDTGRLEEALKILEPLAEAAPHDPELGCQLAGILVQTGSAARAIEILEPSRPGGSGKPWWHTRRGLALAESGDAAGGEREYRWAIAVDPAHSEAHHRLGRLLASRGREEEARPHLERHRRLRTLESEEQRLQEALEDARDEVPILIELSRVRRLLGRRSEAAAALERAIRLEPQEARLETLRLE